MSENIEKNIKIKVKKNSKTTENANSRTKKLKKILDIRDNTKGSKPITALISKNLKKIRKIPIQERPYTQKELAKILKMDEKNYAKIEREQKKLSFEKALRLSKEYNISLDYIYGLTNNKGEEISTLLILQNFVDIQYNEFTGEKDLIFKISEDMKNCLKQSIELEKEYSKKRLTKEEYNQYNNKKSDIENRYQKAIENTKNTNTIGYYLINIQKIKNYQANKEFMDVVEYLQNNEQ